MSFTLPVIADTQFPTINPALVAPTLDQVAALERTRTVDENGNDQPTFTASTHPTATEAMNIIAQATQAILTRLPVSIPEVLYGRVTHAIALYAAVLIEGSYFREQISQGSVSLYMGLMDTLLQTLSEVAGGQRQGRRVDSVVMRGTQAEYMPYYPLPPPRQIIEIPATS